MVFYLTEVHSFERAFKLVAVPTSDGFVSSAIINNAGGLSHILAG